MDAKILIFISILIVTCLLTAKVFSPNDHLEKKLERIKGKPVAYTITVDPGGKFTLDYYEKDRDANSQKEE